MASSAPSLKELLEQSKRLTTHIISPDLPQIERSLETLENQSRKLAAKATTREDGIRGPISSPLRSLIEPLQQVQVLEPVQPLHDTDVEGYLRHEHEQIIINAIEEGRRKTLGDFDECLERSLHLDWERFKKKIFEELGQHQGRSSTAGGKLDGTSSLLRSSMGASGFRASVSTPFSPTKSLSTSVMRDESAVSSLPTPTLQMHTRMMRYAKAVRALNDHRLQGKDFGVVHVFRDVALSLLQDAKLHSIAECGRLLATLIGEEYVLNGEFQRQPLKARQYARAYLYSPYNSPQGVELRQKLVRGAKRFLEEQFLGFVEKTIAQNPHEAKIGGVPSVRNKIQGYINIRYKKHGMWTNKKLQIVNNDTAIWAQIFYLMRCGHEREALQFAIEHENVLQKIESSFLAYFKAYMDSEDRRLPKNIQNRLLSEYNQLVHYSSGPVDPYRLAVYKILGRCELSKKTLADAIQTLEDYLWLQFALVRESTNVQESPQDRYTLFDLQNIVLKYGPAHFNPKGNNPVSYFQVLLLSGQFERAIDYLVQTDQYQVDAVHFAIALAYYGLLRIPENPHVADVNYVTITTDESGNEVPRFDFARLVYQYTRMFARSEPQDALQYLYLLCLYGKDTEEGLHLVRLCHAYVRDLALETRDYSGLLGEARRDGTRVPGSIEQYMKLMFLSNEREFVQNITMQAARKSHTDGRYFDAVHLYNLAEEYDTVVQILNEQLGEALTLPLHHQAQSTELAPPTGAFGGGEDIKSLAENVMTYYMQYPYISARISERSKTTCSLLLQLLQFTSLYDEGQFEQALQLMEQLNLIPLESDMALITRKADDLRDLDETIARNFSQLLLMTMTILYKLYTALKESPYGDSERQLKMNLLRRKARALMIFAGMIQFRMPADMYARLNRLDVFMN
ncbi:uncharacterized protein VTP21DRAFT_8560 [Calcarisporiella thermophila]|uniref:uncharacterized protein n=1 Tax=Calcarisporiella thermophila TaxID=911321 RepID=UPI003743D5E8